MTAAERILIVVSIALAVSAWGLVLVASIQMSCAAPRHFDAQGMIEILDRAQFYCGDRWLPEPSSENTSLLDQCPMVDPWLRDRR
jgi:hypothetical protein